MKKIFAFTAALAVCFTLTSCGDKNPLLEDTSAIEQYIEQASKTSQTEVTTTSVTMAEITEVTTAETSTESEISFEELALIRLDEMMNSLIEKDAGTWQNYTWYYFEGNDGYLYNVDFEDYKIIDFSLTEEHELYHYAAAVFNVEINVSESNDIRFPQGWSRWKVLLGGDKLNFCAYFLSDIYSEAGLYEAIYSKSELYEDADIKPAELGYVFSYSFKCFETVSDIRKYCLDMDYKSFLDGLTAFIRVADEVTPQTVNEWGDPYYSKDDVNTIVSKYLGITDYSWDENFAGLGGDRLWKVWDMTTIHAVITEQTDSYVDMVYFADYVYLTPAKKMRYYFTYNDDTIQLLSTELLEDYGYEPNWEYN